MKLLVHLYLKNDQLIKRVAIFIVLICGLNTTSLFAQNRFEAGEIKFKDGTSLVTDILFDISKNRYKKVTYLENKERKLVQAGDVLRIEFVQGLILVSYNGELRELIVEGDVSLFNTQNGFLLKTKSEETLLTRGSRELTVDNQTPSTSDQRWKSQLYDVLKTCDRIDVDRIKSVKDNSKSLAKIIDEFNNCENPILESESKPQKKPGWLGLNLSYAAPSLSGVSPLMSNGGTSDSSLPLKIGAFFLKSFDSGKSGIELGLSYSSVSGQLVANDVLSGLFVIRNGLPVFRATDVSAFVTEADLDYVSASFGIRKFISTGESNLFVQLGFSLNAMVNSNINVRETKERLVNQTVPPAIRDTEVSLNNSVNLGFTLKGGWLKDIGRGLIEINASYDILPSIGLDHNSTDFIEFLEGINAPDENIFNGVSSFNLGVTYYFSK